MLAEGGSGHGWIQARAAEPGQISENCLDLLGRNDCSIDALFGRALHQLIVLVLLAVDFHAQLQPLDPVAAGAHGRAERLRAIDGDLGHVQLHFAARAAALDVFHDDGWARRIEAGERDVSAAWRAVRLRVHDRNHASRIRQPGAAREPPHHVEEVQGVEVDLFVDGLERRNLFLIDGQPVLGFAQGQIDGQLAEERRVFRPRLALAERHHVIVQGRQRPRLEVIPEALRIGRNPLVDKRAAGDVGPEPAGGDAHALVVGKPIEERTLDDGRLERSPQQLGAARSGGEHFVGRRSDGHLLEADPVTLDLQLGGEDLVDRIQLEQPPRRRIHALLLPAGRRSDFAKADRDLVDGLARERRPDHVVQPAVSLLVGRQHRDGSPRQP